MTPEADIDPTGPEWDFARAAPWEYLDSEVVNKVHSSIYFDVLKLFQNYLMTSLKDVIEENQTITGLCIHPLAVVTLNTGSSTPIYTRQYPSPRKYWPVIQSQVEDWMKQGTTRLLQEHSPWNNPLITVQKKDVNGTVKGYRVCLDPRPLNKLFPAIPYPLPLIKELLESLTGSVVFSRIDLRASFHQFQLKEEDQVKTTFTWRGTQYCFVGAPFGLKHVSSIFQIVMHAIFGSWSFVRVFIDDIVIHSPTFASHRQHLLLVFLELRKFHLRVNPQKCELGRDKLGLLGYTVSQNGIAISQEKVLQLDQWEIPTTGKMLQRQLGFLNFFRELIPMYSKLTAPLDALIKNIKNLKGLWTDEHSAIYGKLKEIMKSGLVLSFPDFSCPFCIATDASNKGIGGVLYQGSIEKPKFISFAARSLSESERRYGATQRELLGVVFCLNKFQYHISGSKFTLYTDHKALTYMFDQKRLKPFLLNWIETLLSFDFDVVYRPGIKNVLPDKISRLYDDDPLEEKENEVVWMVPTTSHHTPSSNKRTYDDLETNPVTTEQKTSVEIPSRDPEDLEIVPETDRQQLLISSHSQGHFGAAHLVKNLIHQGKYWASLRRDAIELVKSCVPCQRFNIGKHGFHPLTPVTASMPWNHISMDLKSLPKSDKGYTYLLVIVDVFTKFTFLRPVKNKSASTVAKELPILFTDVGFPRILQSDNGTEFSNHVLKALYDSSGIRHRTITPYHARANGLAEKAVDISATVILKLANGAINKWHEFCPAAQFFMNNRVQNSTGSTPFTLMFARSSQPVGDFQNTGERVQDPDALASRVKYLTEIVYPTINVRLDAKNSKRAEYFNKKHRIISDTLFQPGALVFVKDELRSNKTQPRYTGPFKIMRRTRGGTYELKGPDGTLYTRPPNALKLVSQSMPFHEDSVEVERILSHKIINDEDHYLVKWKQREEQFNEWVPVTSFDSQAPIEAFWKSHQTNKPIRIHLKVPKIQEVNSTQQQSPAE